MQRLEITGIGTTRVGNVPVLILRSENDGRVIPVQLDPLEVDALAAELQGVRSPRPLTHDLLTDVVHQMGASVTRVAITDIRDDAFHAQITLDTPHGEVGVDARPSDAVALAVRANAPIFATDRVIDEGSVEIEYDDEDDTPDDEIARFRDFLDTIEPADFDAAGPGDGLR